MGMTIKPIISNGRIVTQNFEIVNKFSDLFITITAKIYIEFKDLYNLLKIRKVIVVLLFKEAMQFHKFNSCDLINSVGGQTWGAAAC
ncbi:hypothetical protein Dsin_021479 [Dipteronia sinensis]|uniref:Uncharacterized protein n=1 Tax=Dipteronia sinensis TaxID=43782 RepID=A0AAD9ZZV0_9ROSI|nr:hypothetical protein Dsin_021479 [Dipteronia sinensis]